MYIILVYDIQMDETGRKKLPKVFKTCKKFLTHIQCSVFEGEITESNFKKLTKILSNLICENDSIIIYKIRQQQWIHKEFIGNKNDKTDNFF